jgi:peptidoglycan/LPS O-acetylase OafA/YrhL
MEPGRRDAAADPRTVDAGRAITERLPAIDLLRGVAIAFVLVHHLYGGFIRAPIFLEHPVLLAIPANGFYGVNLFFVLSGFVLFLPMVRRDAAPVGGAELARFYRRRARRLLPLYYLSAAVAFALAVGWAWPSAEQWRTLASVVTFTFQFEGARFFPNFHPVVWSLAVEVSFSIVMPFLAVLWLRVPTPYVLGTIVAATTVTRCLGMALGPVMPLVSGLPGRLDDFAVGMTAAWAYARRPPPARPWIWIAGGIVLVQLGCLTSDVRTGTLFLRATVVPWLLVTGFFAIVRGALVVARPTSMRALQVAGRMSYSLYLWHLMLRDLMMPVVAFAPRTPVGLYVVTLFAVSALSYRWIEFGHVRDWRALFLVRREATDDGRPSGRRSS